jgi:hypothetical protein
MTDAVDMEAIANQRLTNLLQSGAWMITGHGGTDDDRAAHSVWLNGIRVWPDGSADSLVVEAFHTARAERTDIKGSVVWRSSGHLADVLAELLELKPPDDPQASTEETSTKETYAGGLRLIS